MSDPNGVPFTVAPVRSDDPKKKEDKDKKKDDRDGVDTTFVDGKPAKVDGKKEDDEEELVSTRRAARGTYGKSPNR